MISLLTFLLLIREISGITSVGQWEKLNYQYNGTFAQRSVLPAASFLRPIKRRVLHSVRSINLKRRCFYLLRRFLWAYNFNLKQKWTLIERGNGNSQFRYHTMKYSNSLQTLINILWSCFHEYSVWLGCGR